MEAILQGGREMERAVNCLQQNPAIIQAVRLAVRNTNGMSAQDADDVMWEGLWVLCKQIREGKFGGNSSIKTFFKGIVENLCKNQYSKRSRWLKFLDKFKPQEEVQASAEKEMLLREKAALLKKLAGMIDPNCQLVLELFSKGFFMKEILHQTDDRFKDLEALKNFKKNCLRKIRQYMLDNPNVAVFFKR